MPTRAPVAETPQHESATVSMLAIGTRRVSALTGLLVGSTLFAMPLGYLTRPYIVYRSRDTQLGSRASRRGWERVR